MKFLTLICTVVLTRADVEKVKLEKVQKIKADDLRLVQDKDKPRVHAHQAQDLQVNKIFKSKNDAYQYRKDNIEDVILKELNDLKFTYTKGRKGRRKNPKTEVLNTDEAQRDTYLEIPDLEDTRLDNNVKNKDVTGKTLKSIKNEGNQSNDAGDEDMKLYVSPVDDSENSHAKSKLTKDKHGKHKGASDKKRVVDVSDLKTNVADTFTGTDNMEGTVLPETVSSDVMIRRMKNKKSTQHGIPDLENMGGKKGKKKNPKGKRLELKLNNALVGDAQHADAKLSIPELEGSGNNDNTLSKGGEKKHGKSKASHINEVKTNKIETDKQERESTDDDKINRKEARLGDKIIKVSNNMKSSNDAKKEDGMSDKFQLPGTENSDTKDVKNNSSDHEALKGSEDKNKSSSVKYNLNLENVKLKDVNLKIPDLENSNLGHLIGSKSVRVNVSVDVVKLEGMQIKVPESQQSSVKGDKNDSMPFRELKDNKVGKAIEINDTDDVKNADFRPIEEPKHEKDTGKLRVPESEVLEFADKNKDVQVKGITINKFKDLRAMKQNVSTPVENKHEQNKAGINKFAGDQKIRGSDIEEHHPLQMEEMRRGDDLKIKSIKIKGLNNVKMDDLDGEGSENIHASKLRERKAGLDKHYIKIKGIRIRGVNGMRIKDVKLEDVNLPVGGEKGHQKKTMKVKVINIEGDNSNAKPTKERFLMHSKTQHDRKKKMGYSKDFDIEDFNIDDADISTRLKAQGGNSRTSEDIDDEEREAEIKAREKKRKSRKISATRNIKHQRSSKNDVKFTKDEGMIKQGLHVKGVTGWRTGNDEDIKLDAYNNDKANNSDGEDNAPLHTRDTSDRSIKLDEDVDLYSDADPNIEGITRLEDDDDTIKEFKLSEDDDKTEDTNGEKSLLFHENFDDMQRKDTLRHKTREHKRYGTDKKRN